MNWVVQKMKEGSTWAGIAVIVGGLTFVPHSADIAKLIVPLGTVVAGALAIWFP